MTTRGIKVALAQRSPEPIDGTLESFAADVAATLTDHPGTGLIVYPEMHLCGTEHLPEDERPAALEAGAVRLDSKYVAALGAIAARHNVWLCPGSIGEIGTDGKFYNTQLLFAPNGELQATYRKMFPWRPFEPHVPGTHFTVHDLDSFTASDAANDAAASQPHGIVGLSICYDAWFPEHSRQLAWLGAELILNIVKTTSPDREQELILARANAITNQNVMASVNCAGPVGRGRSIVVGPEGFVIAEAGIGEETLTFTFNPNDVTEVRERGTMFSNRVWNQFTPDDAPVPLPMYNGQISPAEWAPPTRRP